MCRAIAEGSRDPYTVPPDNFQDQVSSLLEHEFEPVPLGAIVNLLKRGQQGPGMNLDSRLRRGFVKGCRRQ